MKVAWIFYLFAWLTINGYSAKASPQDYSLNATENTENVDSRRILRSCPETIGNDGIYEITPSGHDSLPVLCNARSEGASWIVIARRSNVNLNFFRNWTDYQKGFGDLSSDFFIGLDVIHAITKSGTHELYIELEDFNGNIRYAQYNEFYIESEYGLYKMSKLGAYSGNAGDALRYHKDQPFSTYDVDNSPSPENCALRYLGAWWYNDCLHSNLFGMYFAGEYSVDMFAKGMVWFEWRGMVYSFRDMKMMVRPKSCSC